MRCRLYRSRILSACWYGWSQRMPPLHRCRSRRCPDNPGTCRNRRRFACSRHDRHRRFYPGTATPGSGLPPDRRNRGYGRLPDRWNVRSCSYRCSCRSHRRIPAACRCKLLRRTLRRSYDRNRMNRSQQISDRQSPDGFWCPRYPALRRGWPERCIPTGHNRSVGH
ncbi:hypothetical protein D3C78_1360200 [compost metagenome]